VKESVEGIVEAVTGNSITIETEQGIALTLPRFYGEVPNPGTAVVISYSEGGPQISIKAPVTKIASIDKFLNFNMFSFSVKTGNVGAEGLSEASDTPSNNVPFSFIDTPIGSKTIIASNGNVSFAGPTAAGIAVSCENKLILRDTSEMELVSPHFVSMQGKTIIVNSFKYDLMVEIDISRNAVESEIDFISIKEEIAKKILFGLDEKFYTYEEALEDSYDLFEYPGFLNLFGLHLAEILCVFSWERLKFSGNDMVLSGVLDGIAEIKGFQDIARCDFGDGKIRSGEFWFTPKPEGDTGLNFAAVVIPTSSVDLKGKVQECILKRKGEVKSVYAYNLTLSNGTIIEYKARAREYSFDTASVSDRISVSSRETGSYHRRAHSEIEQMNFGKLVIGDYIFDAVDTLHSSVEFQSDFELSSTGKLSFSSAVELFLLGQGRGLRIDGEGSTAITI